MTRPVNDDATHQHPFTVNIEPNEKVLGRDTACQRCRDSGHRSASAAQ